MNGGGRIWLGGWLSGVNENSNCVLLRIGGGEFLVDDGIGVGLDRSRLMLVKGGLDGGGCKLMGDKKDLGYSFGWEGGGGGGSCDIWGWEGFYLGVLWMLNRIGWVSFYWDWKEMRLWEGKV